MGGSPFSKEAGDPGSVRLQVAGGDVTRTRRQRTGGESKRSGDHGPHAPKLGPLEVSRFYFFLLMTLVWDYGYFLHPSLDPY